MGELYVPYAFIARCLIIIRYRNKFTFTYSGRYNRVCFIHSVARGSVSGTFFVYSFRNVHD
jgi:hypothetical protein